MRRLLCNFRWAMLLAVAVLAISAPAAEVSDADFLTPGARGKVVTVLRGHETREIPVRYIGIYEDFAGPGYDLHLVELEGPDAEHLGVAAGMSGSPVYFDGNLIGALAYRLGLLPKTAVAGVTPLVDILAGSRFDEAAAGRADSRLSPIATPVVVGGMAPAVRDWLAPQLEQRGFVLVAGGASGGGAAQPRALGPGSPVGVQLIRGDMKMAATGTVTWVDDETVYAFGHPFLGTGRVDLPMVSAEVIHTLADLAGSVKLSNVGQELGAIVEDRSSGVVGRIGQRARMVPIRVQLGGADYDEQEFRYEVVHHRDLAPLLAGVTVANSLRSNVGYTQDTTLLATGAVTIKNLGELPLEMAFTAGSGSDPGFAVANEVFSVLGALWGNPFTDVEIERVDLRVKARPGIAGYLLQNVRYDRGPLEPGEQVVVQCDLLRFKGEVVTREMRLTLPERFSANDGLMLAVGSPEGVDRALGGPLAQRLSSARDLPAYVEALDDRRSAHRLTAVVYRPGHSVVSRGASYAGLPPTAERLLKTQMPARRRPTQLVSPMSRIEEELDGPVTGVLRLRLRVDRPVESGRDR